MTEHAERFWRGDVVWVRSVHPDRTYQQGLWYVEYAPRDGDTQVSLVSSLYGGYTQWMVDLDRVVLSARGNHYNLEHGLSLSFDDIAHEASFWVEQGLMKDVPYDFEGMFVWAIEQALAALERGELDAAFWVSGPHYPNGDTQPVLSGYLCVLPEVAARMRAACIEILQLAQAELAAQ